MTGVRLRLFVLSLGVIGLGLVYATLFHTADAPSSAAFRLFNSPWDWDSIQWMEDQALELGVGFAPQGVYALDHDSALLYGGVAVPAGIIRSIVLRTDDGGQTWQEVMQPIRGSSVVFMSFLEDGEGWALAAWLVEGWGPLVLWHTTDGGLNWAKRADVPKSEWYGYPLQMTFSDVTHGQIDVMYDSGLPETNRVAYLTTEDGGATWLETGSQPMGNPQSEEAYATALAPYGGEEASHYRGFQSTAADGSTWELTNNQETKQLLLSRRFQNTLNVYLLPTRFTYAQGILTAIPAS